MSRRRAPTGSSLGGSRKKCSIKINNGKLEVSTCRCAPIIVCLIELLDQLIRFGDWRVADEAAADVGRGFAVEQWASD